MASKNKLRRSSRSDFWFSREDEASLTVRFFDEPVIPRNLLQRKFNQTLLKKLIHRMEGWAVTSQIFFHHSTTRLGFFSKSFPNKFIIIFGPKLPGIRKWPISNVTQIRNVVNELTFSINADDICNSYLHQLVLLVHKFHLWKGTFTAQFYINLQVQISRFTPSSTNFLIGIFY